MFGSHSSRQGAPLIESCSSSHPQNLGRHCKGQKETASVGKECLMTTLFAASGSARTHGLQGMGVWDDDEKNDYAAGQHCIEDTASRKTCS